MSSCNTILAVVLFVAIGLSALTQGCGGGSGWNSKLNTPLNIRWSQGGRAEDTFTQYVAAGSDGTIYAFASSREFKNNSYAPYSVYALDPHNGGIRWRFTAEESINTKKSRSESALVLYDPSSRVPLYFTSEDTVVVRLPGTRDSTPGMTLYGLTRATGTQRWRLDNLLLDIERVGDRLAVVDLASRGEIRLIDPETGTVCQAILWTGKGEIREVDGLPDSILARDDERLACFDAVTGVERWAIPYRGEGSVIGQSVFTAPGRSEVYAVLPESVAHGLGRLDPLTGKIMWGTEKLPGGEIRVAIGADGAALLWENGSNELSARDPESGLRRWGYYLGVPWEPSDSGRGVATSMVAGGTVYVVRVDWSGANDRHFRGGDLVALDLKTGQERWKVTSEGRGLNGPPALTQDGGLIFLEGDRVICLEGQ